VITPDNEPIVDSPEGYQPGWITILVTLLLVLALLASLVWPLLPVKQQRRPVPPTPTPIFLQEA
jgi:hypothetical protein